MGKLFQPAGKPVLIALALCAASTVEVNAQEWRFLDAGAAYFGAGVSGVRTGDLDERLTARGYPDFGSSGRAFSLGAHMILPGGVTLGAEWTGFDVGDGEQEGRDVGLGGGYGTLGFGYVIELSPQFRIYPRVGLGGGGIGLWIETDSSDIGFDEVLADPEPSPDPLREPVLSTGSAVVDLGAGAEFLPGGWGRGLMVGLRLGYVAAPFASDWRIHEREVTGGPGTSIGGPYIRATVGIARRHPRP